MGLRLIHKINITDYLEDSIVTAVQLWNNDLLPFSSVNNKRVHSPGQEGMNMPGCLVSL